VVQVYQRFRGTFCLHHIPDDGGSKYHRNFGKLVPNYTAQQPTTVMSILSHKRCRICHHLSIVLASQERFCPWRHCPGYTVAVSINTALTTVSLAHSLPHSNCVTRYMRRANALVTPPAQCVTGAVSAPNSQQVAPPTEQLLCSVLYSGCDIFFLSKRY
jgi:hypothetical protein